jgi:L-threonylcarbamoyladenylate synthase
MLLRNLTTTTQESLVTEAVDALKQGGVVLYPTDTLYGLGADAFSDGAVDKVFAIKERNDGKPVHAIVSDLGMANQYGEIDDRVRRLVSELPTGKITFIVPKRKGVSGGIARELETFGFRIPDHQFCLSMVRAFGKPITATSANASGYPPQNSLGPIFIQLGKTVGLIDVAINGGDLPESKPSTVLDCTGIEIKVLREGAVSAKEIVRALTY